MASHIDVSPAVRRALRLISCHPQTHSIASVQPNSQTNTTRVVVEVRVPLSQRWAADGVSPHGVRRIEPVTLTFGAKYPLKPPKVQLRSDFDRSLAHINPGPSDDPPEPCLFEGPIDDLFHQRGLLGVLNQLALWLDKAASGRLIDPKQGWEPIRRDLLECVVLADPGVLRSRVTDDAGFALLPVFYRFEGNGDRTYIASVQTEAEESPDTLVQKLWASQHQEQGFDNQEGTSLAALVWPAASDIDRNFRPDTVRTVLDLEDLAASFRCKGSLRSAMRRLRKGINRNNDGLYDGALPLVVILCARRPYPLVGTDSNVEIIPYVAEVEPNGQVLTNKSVPILPAALRHHITPTLLRRMSGLHDLEQIRPWTLLGAGSLGSKLGVQLARAGAGPHRVIDKGGMFPHNAARHALIPLGGNRQLYWSAGKAMLLANAVSSLGSPSQGLRVDMLSLAQRPPFLEHAQDDWAFVNATGSLAVREALSRFPVEVLTTRVIDASLFASGTIGVFSVEGPHRNPNTGDLIAWTYHLAQQDRALGSALFSAQGLSRRLVGEGCGSTTMVMSDARLSMFSSAMGVMLIRLYQEDLPAEGRLCLGFLHGDEVTLRWRKHSLGITQVAADDSTSISVRVLAPAHEKIEAEVKRHPSVETGGVLLGRYSEASETFYVVDVLPAPPDSRRTANEFVLGMRGLAHELKSYAESAEGALYSLGTWHSHLHPSGPSALDRETAAILQQGRPAPSVMLIHTPAGYRVLSATD